MAGMARKHAVESIMRSILLLSALASVLIVLMIGYFTVREAMPAFEGIGFERLLTGREWRPGQDMYGLLSMIAGSGLVTLGALVLGLPLSLGCAVFLAEVAPVAVRSVVKPAIELLAGIPSVVFGLFGMVVIVPLIRNIDAPGNAGFGLLAASVVLAIMILPTIASVAEVAIRSVPDEYRQGSLALGATRWETIRRVVIPGASSGILSAVVLGMGRAIGETIAMIMVIGNSIVMPAVTGDNPLTLFLSRARTLTGNIAVEITYATGLHADALFATGVVLFALIIVVNTTARALMARSLGRSR